MAHRFDSNEIIKTSWWASVPCWVAPRLINVNVDLELVDLECAESGLMFLAGSMLMTLRWMIPPMVVHPEKIDLRRFV